jgi:hypothetical protein
MPGGRARAAEIIAAAQEVSEPLGLRSRRRHEPQHPAAIKGHQLLRVTTVGLHLVAGADRDQRRRDHVTRDPQPPQQPVQLKPAGPGLIADRQPVGTAELLDQPAHRLLGRLDPRHLRLAAGRRQRRDNDRQLVHIEADPQTHIRGLVGANVRHGWSSVVAALAEVALNTA